MGLIKKLLLLAVFVLFLVWAVSIVFKPFYTKWLSGSTSSQKLLSLPKNKEVFLNKSLLDLSLQDQNKMRGFFEDFGIEESLRKNLSLLYLYPYGFFETTKDIRISQYSSSLHDFALSMPSNWSLFPHETNNIVLLSPETKSQSKQLLPQNEAFDIQIIKDCKPFTRLIDFITSQKDRGAPLEKLAGPIEVTYEGFPDAEMYVFSVPLNKLSVETSGMEGEFVIEDYFINSNKNFYRVSVRYQSQYRDKYKEEAKLILESLKLGDRSCSEEAKDFNYENLDIFLTGWGSNYNRKPTD